MTPDTRDLAKRIGLAVKRHRVHLEHLEQKELAAKAGISQGAVSLIENGERSSLASLEKIALALGYKLSDLILMAESIDDTEAVLAEATEFVNS